MEEGQMQISNLVSQYQRNTNSNSTDELKGASSMQKLVSSLGELETGSVFEGTVSSIRGGKVTLALSTGQQIVAKLDGKVSLSIGTPMFFQVKSNDGGVMAIRPYQGNGTGGNPILLNALTSAGIPVTERNLDMVNAMMQRQMPINKQSVLDMVKAVSSNETTAIDTIVDMTRLGIPIDGEMAKQFEKYQNHDYILAGKMESAITETVEFLGSDKLTAKQTVEMNQKLLDMVTRPDSNVKEMADVTLELHTMAAQGKEETLFVNQPLHEVFTKEQLGNLLKLVQSTPALLENSALFVTEGEASLFVDTLSEETNLADKLQTFDEKQAATPSLNDKLTVDEFLNQIKESLKDQTEYGFLGVQKLLGSKEYKHLLKNVMQEQWLLKPEELTPGKVSKSYERMINQIDRLEEIVKATGAEANKLFETTADIRNNVEFLNQINQMYTYVQLPLKLTGQQANGDLYVYTNKKNLRDPDGELSAFLHLDLEYLGSTDVSVKMQRKHVKTNFYFAEDMSYEIVEKHLPLLETRLNKKGYTCSFEIAKEGKKIDFVNDFLRKDLPTAGTLHRYSFDVRT